MRGNIGPCPRVTPLSPTLCISATPESTQMSLSTLRKFYTAGPGWLQPGSYEGLEVSRAGPQGIGRVGLVHFSRMMQYGEECLITNKGVCGRCGRTLFFDKCMKLELFFRFH